MVLVRVLQRRDAASLVVGIAAGLSVFTFVSTVTNHLVALLSGIEVEASFTDDYWQPFVALVLQLVALELIVRVAIVLRGAMGGRK